MKPIFLIGFMCSGKSTLGRALKRATGIEFIDLDEYIEQIMGMSVKQIFARLGENEFRRIESDALCRLAKSQDVIVACGGGTPCRPGAMELMNDAGTTVWLVPEQARLVNRLMCGRHKRPLLAGIDSAARMAEFADAKINERRPYYSKAKATFDTTMLETDAEVSATVDEFIKRFIVT